MLATIFVFSRWRWPRSCAQLPADLVSGRSSRYPYPPAVHVQFRITVQISIRFLVYARTDHYPALTRDPRDSRLSPPETRDFTIYFYYRLHAQTRRRESPKRRLQRVISISFDSRYPEFSLSRTQTQTLFLGPDGRDEIIARACNYFSASKRNDFRQDKSRVDPHVSTKILRFAQKT